MFSEGDEAHEGYLKVAKKHAKKEEEQKKEAKKTQKRPRPSGYGHGSFQSGYQYQAPMASMAPTWQTQPPPPLGLGMSPRIPKSHLRCLNCAELGHFAKECTRLASAQK